VKRIFLLISLVFFLPSISIGFYTDDPYHEQYVLDRIAASRSVLATLKQKVEYFQNLVIKLGFSAVSNDQIAMWAALNRQIRALEDQIEQLEDEIE
jgi:hypothetical protein